MRCAFVLGIFISAANLLVDRRFFRLRRHFALEMLASVRTVRGRSGECDKLIESVLFIYKFIIRFDTTPRKSQSILAGPSLFLYLFFTAACKSLLFI